ncbi:MAG: DNA primase [Rhodospirillales bacterium]|nr:DNA primase [Rhodospirillales bacterium]
MGFSPHFLDELRTRLSLVEVVARKVRLVRKGREHGGLCPFHNEKTPSFTVSEDKGFFHCFGCGAHGDVIGFVMRAQGLSFPEAVERLAGEAGMPIPVTTPEERERAQRETSLHEVMEAACVYYERMLRAPEGRVALDYLRNRDLSEDTIARFRLGFAPDDRHALKTALLGGGITKELLIEAGLLIEPEGEREPYDRFRGRVMFPITDRRGRVIAFGGRVMGDGQPKYLNSPDTPLFHKGRVLFALAQAREAARAEQTLVVSEGYMDVIAMHQAGLGFAVAPLGTALTETQIEELWKLVPEPILCFDGDAAGQRAAARALERALPLLKAGHSLRFAVLPKGEDPDSLIRAKGVAALRAVLDGARPLFEVLWSLETQGSRLDTPERRAGLDKRLDDHIRTIADRSVQTQYFHMKRERMRAAFAPARGPAGRGGRGGPSGRVGYSPAPTSPRTPLSADSIRERVLLACVLLHPDILDGVAERLAQVHFTEPTLDKLRQEVLKHGTRESHLDSAALRHYLAEQGLSGIVDSVTGAEFLMVHASFARPDSPKAEVIAGFRHTLDVHEVGHLAADMAQAERHLGTDLSDSNVGKLLALSREKSSRFDSFDPDEGTREPTAPAGKGRNRTRNA